MQRKTWIRSISIFLLCVMFIAISASDTYAKYKVTSNSINMKLSVVPAPFQATLDVGDMTPIVNTGANSWNVLKSDKYGVLSSKYGYFKIVSSDTNSITFQIRGYQGGWEKFAIPLRNLLAGYKYKLSFNCYIAETRSVSQYRYGCTVVDYATKEAYLSQDGGYYDHSVEVLWDHDRTTYTTEGAFTYTGCAVFFTATDNTMYWLWDTSDIDNNDQYNLSKNYSITNVTVTLLENQSENMTSIQGTCTPDSSVSFNSIGGSQEAGGNGHGSGTASGGTYYIDTSAVSGISIPEIDMMGNNWPVGVDTMLTLEPYAGTKLPFYIYVEVGGGFYEISTAQNSMSSSTINSVNGIEFDTRYKELYIPASLITGSVRITAIAE